jgi:hypothetical protein
MVDQSASAVIDEWPEESREAAQLVIDTYGQPQEATASMLIWHSAGPWKRIVASKVFYERCHDEQANFLALNLMHDIVTGEKNIEQARQYYAKEFLDARRKKPTPYMEKLRFSPGENTADPDEPVLSEQDLEQAAAEGERNEQAQS